MQSDETDSKLDIFKFEYKMIHFYNIYIHPIQMEVSFSVLLIGLPATGKTTLIRSMTSNL